MGTYDYGRAQRSAELIERWRVLEEAKKAGWWTNLVPIQCPQCGDVHQWPGHWSRPTCAKCYLRADESVRMRWVRAVTKPDDLDPVEPPELPPGLRPFESNVLRGIRRAVTKAAKDERHLIARWLRRQADRGDEVDAKALAETVKSGQYRLEMRD